MSVYPRWKRPYQHRDHNHDRAILEAINESIEKRGCAPSIREIGEVMGGASTSVANYHLNRLRADRLITREKGIGRAMCLTDAGRQFIGKQGRHIAITLPFPPTTNHMYRPNGRGGRIKTAEYNTFTEHVGYLANGLTPLEGSVAVRLILHRPTNSGDLDNRIKPTLDAMQGYAYANDKQITELSIRFGDNDKSNPRIEFEAWEAP